MGLWTSVKVNITWISLIERMPIVLKFLFAVVTFCFSCVVSADTLNKIVVFGDSLSDNGNLYEYMKHQLPMSPPYYKGRFTNGPVWVEHLAAHYFPQNPDAHLLNYAFGGSGIGVDEDDMDDDDEALLSLDKEIDSYLLAHHDKADPQSLFIVWMGSNNYLGLPEESEDPVMRATQSLRRSIERLIEKGAKKIMVVNLPDLGRIPAAVDFDATELLSNYAQEHNRVLEKDVALMQEKYPHVRWVLLDVESILNRALDFPENYGFTNTTGTCYEDATYSSSNPSILKMVSKIKRSSGVNQNACDGYLFFDPVHPSGPAHTLLAKDAWELLEKSEIF